MDNMLVIYPNLNIEKKVSFAGHNRGHIETDLEKAQAAATAAKLEELTIWQEVGVKILEVAAYVTHFGGKILSKKRLKWARIGLYCNLSLLIAL